MKPTIMCMQRIEKKYLLSKESYEQLMSYIHDEIIDDVYAKSTICNIYYDTDDYRLIKDSLSKPLYKEKFRIRSYGIPKLDSSVYLEIKKKSKGVVSKRRIAMSYQNVMKALDESIDKTQIGKEIHYMIDFYQPKPKVFIAYDRLAFKGKKDDELRITFDFNIRSRFDHLELGYGDEGK